MTGQRVRLSPSVLFPLVLALVVFGGAGWWLVGELRASGSTERREPVAIQADGPVFTTLDELVAASDIVVRGTVVDVDDGRSITDPADATAGIRTRLARVEVSTVLKGDLGGPLVVEQEAVLLDGTPVIVNGVAPLDAGAEGLLFLQRGDSDEFPYTALVNEQSWVPIVGNRLAPIDATDRLWSPFSGQLLESLALD